MEINNPTQAGNDAMKIFFSGINYDNFIRILDKLFQWSTPVHTKISH